MAAISIPVCEAWMDFSLDAKTRDLCRRIDAFLEAHVMALEQDPSILGEGKNIREVLLQSLLLKARAEGLWCFQMPVAFGGLGLSVTAMAATYEAAGRSIFGPVIFNVAAPDDGNMILLNKIATPAQRERRFLPISRGGKRSGLAVNDAHA